MVDLGEDITNDEWKWHISILVDFWSSVFIDESLYQSDPYGPHFTIVGLNEQDFAVWVKLFSATAESIYTPEIANQFKQKAKFYAKDFMARLEKGIDKDQIRSGLTWEG